MAIEDLINAEVLNDLTHQISFLTTFLQAIGGLILIYLIFSIISFVLNRKKNKELKMINKNLQDIKKLLQNPQGMTSLCLKRK